MNFLWSYLFETGTDRAEILHSCQIRGTEQLLPWLKRGLPLKKSEIPWFAVVLSARARARARPSRAGGLRPLPRKGTGDLPDGARAFIFERSFFRNWRVQVIRRFVILVEIEDVNATERKSKELKKCFITTFFGIQRRHLTIWKFAVCYGSRPTPGRTTEGVGLLFEWPLLFETVAVASL